MRVSVVVPTRDRSYYLSRCLTALRAQTLPAGEYEIIVVDDGSARQPVELPAPSAGERIRLVRREVPAGPATARNDALALAQGAILAFTDDDCRPERDWLEAGCRAIDRGLDIATGRTIPDPQDKVAAGPFAYSMNMPGPDPRFSTCNCFYRADVLRAAGGFRGEFYSSAGYHFGEDTDLAWRAIESGARSGFAGDAIVYHAVRPQTFGEHLRSRRRLENLVPLVKRYPGVKRAHLSSHVYSWSHLFAYVAIGGLVGSLASPWGLALLLPYALWRSRDKRRLPTAPWAFAWRNRAMPLFFLADVYECWVLARASLRHRHVFL